MIIFLYGPDSYRRQEKLKSIIDEYKEKHSAFSIEHFNLENGDAFVALKDFIQARSLFDDLKLGVIHHGNDLGKETKKEYVALLKENIKSKDPVLILIEDKKPTKEFNFLLEKPILSQDFEQLTWIRFKAFFDQEARRRSLQFDRESEDLLLRTYSGDTWALVTELDKLALLDEKRIAGAVLKNHLHASMPVNTFSMIYEMRNARQVGERLALLDELLSRSEDPGMVFNVAASSPYGDTEFKKRVADYDVAVKSGKLEYEEVLLDLALE
jgi:DNA polymerase III delta subunit